MREIAKNSDLSIGGKIPMPGLGKVRNMRMLHDRLRVPEGAKLPFDFCEVHEGKEKMFVFIVHKDKATVLEDDVNMYPSDSFIASLRLLIG